MAPSTAPQLSNASRAPARRARAGAGGWHSVGLTHLAVLTGCSRAACCIDRYVRLRGTVRPGSVRGVRSRPGAASTPVRFIDVSVGRRKICLSERVFG